MIKEASKIAQLVVEFCRNNLDILMIGGAALIVLVIIISVVKSSKDDEDELDYDRETKTVEVVAKPEEKVEPEKETIVEFSEAQNKEKKNTPYIEGLLGELASLSQDGIKELEIKIQGAEVKITYGDKREMPVVEDLAEEGCSVDAGSDTTVEKQGEPKETSERDTESKGDKKIQENNASAKIYKKFGPENNNISKSGRIYTEEELEEQIRD